MWIALILVLNVLFIQLPTTTASKIFKFYGGQGCGVTQPFRVLKRPPIDGSNPKCGMLEAFPNQMTEGEMKLIDQEEGLKGGWSDWSLWSECSSSCGSGTQFRTRTCEGDNCEGLARSMKYCNALFCPIDGGWGGWSTWGECSSTCGTRMRSRNRECSNPPMQHNGKPCEGPHQEFMDCETLDPCPIHGGWTDWSTWTTCTKSCDSGLRSRNRSCFNPVPAFNGRPCLGNENLTRACSTDPCPIDGAWTTWSEWSSCSATCGASHQIRTRNCADPEPQYGGIDCSGAPNETLICTTEPCAVVTPACCDSKTYIGKLTSEAHCDCDCLENEMHNFNWNQESKDCFCGTESCADQCGFQYEGPYTRGETNCEEFE